MRARRWGWLAMLVVAMSAAGCNLLPDDRAPNIMPPRPTAVAQAAPTATPVAANPPTVGGSLPAAQPTSPAPPSGAGRQTDVVRVVKQVGPAVVTVVNKLSPSDVNGFGGEALGTGVIIDQQGHIVTNNHVVEGQQSLTVIYADGSKVDDVHLVGSDSRSDIAVLKVNGNVPAIATLGDSDAIMPGETVVAIGSALGDFRNSVTVGVISGVHRTITGSDPSSSIEDMIQTDAAINHGNSGGPLINLDGEVIGINTAIVRTDTFNTDVAEGLGFAIPSNTVRNISAQLISKGKVSRPYLGVTTVAVSARIAAYYDLRDQNGNPLTSGALVQRVTPSTPAEQAGIRAGDVIIAINQYNLDADHSLGSVLTNFGTSDTVTVHIIRDGRALDLSATLTER